MTSSGARWSDPARPGTATTAEVLVPPPRTPDLDPAVPVTTGPPPSPATTHQAAGTPVGGPFGGVFDTAAAQRADVADVLFGVLSVTVAVGRVATDAGRAALGRLPRPAALTTALGRALQTTGAQGRAERATALSRLHDVADVVVPRAARSLLSRLDVAGLVREFVDLDRLAAALDVDAVVARVDLDRVLARVDLDEIARRLDLDALVDRVDVERIIAKLDLDTIVDRVDLDRAAARLDLDRAAARLDLDRAAARLDLDPIIERVDVLALARWVVEAIDLPQLIRASTASVSTEVVHGVRAQGADADQAVERLVDRILLRRRGRRVLPATPDGGTGDVSGAPGTDSSVEPRHDH